jgi:hypothetical protein
VLEGLESSAYRVGVSLNKRGAMAGLILARVLVLILLVGLGTGCGGGSSSNESRSTTSQTKINTRDKAAAQRIVLHLSDFPTGWRAQPSKNESDEPKCFKLDVSDLTVTGKASSRDFVNGQVTTATSAAGLYEDEQQAHDAYQRIANEKLAKCISDWVRTQSTSDAKITDSSFGKLGFPKLGDQSSAYQIAMTLEAQGLTPTAYVDLVFIRETRALTFLVFLDLFSPFDEQLKEDLARKVASRMPTT